MLRQPPEIDHARCGGCGRCLPACPFGLLSLETTGFRKRAMLAQTERCTGCQRCVVACQVDALKPRSL
jgi:Fe-S-cluster-containing hydrogenase component 2